MKRKCIATTVNGYPCRGKPLPNNPHCKRHDYSKRPRCNFIIKGKTYEGKVSPTRRCSKHINIKIHNSRCKYHRNKVKNVEVKNVEVKNVEEEDKMEKRGILKFKKRLELLDKKGLTSVLLYLYEQGTEEQIERAVGFIELLELPVKKVSTPVKKVSTPVKKVDFIMIKTPYKNSRGKSQYYSWACPTCHTSNVKGTNIKANDFECRGKCSTCKKNVRNIFFHIEQGSENITFSSRGECKIFCEKINAQRGWMNE